MTKFFCGNLNPKTSLTYLTFIILLILNFNCQLCLNRSTDFKNLEFDPFNSKKFFGLNDQLDLNINLFNGINLIKNYYFDIDGAIKQLKSSQQNSLSIFHLIFIMKI